MKTGLQVLLSDVSILKGNVGVCCNHTAIDIDGSHLIQRLQGAGVSIHRIFGPEHGVESTAQDMIAVEEAGFASDIETVSLYGDTEESLHPTQQSLQDLDMLVFDIQDIGARYYTYQATLGYIMEVTGLYLSKLRF